MDFSEKQIFKEIEKSFGNYQINEMELEDTKDSNRKTLVIGAVRVGEIKVTNNTKSSCDISVSFNSYVKDENFETFMKRLKRLHDVYFEK